MNKTLKVLTIFGTRPEAIKLAPVIQALEKHHITDQVVCVTGQHREMLDQMLSLFAIKPDHDLRVMTESQSLEQISSRVLLGLEDVLEQTKPDLVLVEGDTTTVLMGALAAFYKKIPVGHIEAGLRTDNKYNPFPEEMNRRLTAQLADLHFAPTQQAKQNLLAEGVKPDKIFVTGNTVIDALLWVLEQKRPFESQALKALKTEGRRVILVTTHRRENLGEGMEAIFSAIKRLAGEFSDLLFVFPVHLNPAIQKHATDTFKDVANVVLTEPLGYSDLAKVMQMSYLVMTDSGGIQEEAPALGKPVLVLRDTTERPEGVEAGTAKLAGTAADKIYEYAKELITDSAAYEKMAKAINPYGDGTAAKQIVEIISQKI